MTVAYGCEVLFNEDDAKRIQAMTERAVGGPCPCKMGNPCPLLPAEPVLSRAEPVPEVA